MFESRHGVWLVLVAALLMTATGHANEAAYEAEDIPQLRKQVFAACPASWESIYSHISYQTTEVLDSESGETKTVYPDIWEADASDKARYTTYALEKLLPASIAAETGLTVSYLGADSAVIIACFIERRDLMETYLQTRNDESGGFHVDEVKDDDSDGVFNIADECPELFRTCVRIQDICPDTPQGETPDENGCSASQRDTDDDGVTDDIDFCPGTPAGAVADAEGCIPEQRDTDEDGINDALDQCPGTDAGLAANNEGCALNQVDTDGDGIPDAEDEYPHQHDSMCFP